MSIEVIIAKLLRSYYSWWKRLHSLLLHHMNYIQPQNHKRNFQWVNSKHFWLFNVDLKCHLCSVKPSSVESGVVSNISQCQITRICATARVWSRKVSCAGGYLFDIYFFGWLQLRLGLKLGLGLVVRLGLRLIIPTCRSNLVLRVIWQCDIFGMSTAQGGHI